MASTFDRYLHADTSWGKNARGTKSKYNAIAIVRDVLCRFHGPNIELRRNFKILLRDFSVRLRLDLLIQHNNKRAMRLHLQQQLRHTMHKERATTRQHIKRQPHREPMQVSQCPFRVRFHSFVVVHSPIEFSIPYWRTLFLSFHIQAVCSWIEAIFKMNELIIFLFFSLFFIVFLSFHDFIQYSLHTFVWN